MCYFCEGRRANYEAYRSRLAELRGAVSGIFSFLTNAQAADELRFGSGAEWSEEQLLVRVPRSIFLNPDADRGLLLFVLTCWLDMQMPYTTVWSRCLQQTEEWSTSSAWRNPEVGLPSVRFAKHTHTHLLKTVRTLSATDYNRSLATWMGRSILEIVKSHGHDAGNLYRFVGRICRDLYRASDQRFVKHMREGQLPLQFGGSHYKRLWMLVMFLRRDRSVVRCLLTRALETSSVGREALGYWTDDGYFDSKDCELPVDGRVSVNWNKLGLWERSLTKPDEIAAQARRLAREHSVPAASFDAILFVN
ncbi:MAG: hypothetical protein ABIK85_00185 [Candidatus Eisenbacteria bacterium]